MLSIIIVNYNSEQYLEKCTSSIREKILGVEHEVIVVNNDNLNIKVPSGVKITKTGKNIGFGAACNLGAKEARGEVLCFLNPDTEIISDNMPELLKKISANDSLAVIGPRLITEDGKTQWWCAGKDASIWQLLKNNLGAIESKEVWESKKEISADWVSGAALFVKKEVFEKADGFDKNFFMYGEDMDLCRRIRGLGYFVLYCPEFTILHKGGKSHDNLFRQKIQFFKSSLYYLKKWF